MKSLARSAHRCHLAIAECSVTRELYGSFAPVLDEKSTLRRVALLHRGSGRAHMSQPEKDLALGIIRERFDQRFAA